MFERVLLTDFHAGLSSENFSDLCEYRVELNLFAGIEANHRWVESHDDRAVRCWTEMRLPAVLFPASLDVRDQMSSDLAAECDDHRRLHQGNLSLQEFAATVDRAVLQLFFFGLASLDEAGDVDL